MTRSLPRKSEKSVKALREPLMVPEHLGGYPRDCPGSYPTPTSPLASVFPQQGCPWGPLGLGANPRVGCPRQLEAALVSWIRFVLRIGLAPMATQRDVESTSCPWEPQAPMAPPPNLIELVLLVNVLVCLLTLLANLLIIWNRVACKLITVFLCSSM